MLRVMMLSTDLQRGGLPLRLVRLARGLRDVGIEPVVGCLTGPGPLSTVLSSGGIETFSCDARGRLDASCLFRLARHICYYQPDLVHASLFHANTAARLVGRWDRPRPIITSTVTIEIERAWHRWGEAFSAGASDVHVANSEAVAAHLREDLCYPSEQIRVIPNGIDLRVLDAVSAIDRRHWGIAEDSWLIVWAGRMDPVKNLPVLLEVVQRVGKSRKVCTVLLGDGPERAGLEARARELGLGDRVRFAGWSEQCAAWLKAADCLLFPSRTEGCPNTVLEAMACGCAVIASDIGACRELIVDGREGMLCRVNDTSAFVMALTRLMNAPEAAARMGEAGRQRVLARHGIEQVVAQWADLYVKLIRGGL